MKRLNIAFLCCSLYIVQCSLAQTPQGMVKIRGGVFIPFYKGGEHTQVKSFYIDVCAVTNEQFLQFVKANPKWARSKVSPLFADGNYLNYWASDFNLGKDSDRIKNSPVVNVSWFAADAYSKWKGKRLPTTAEWEYVAQAARAGRFERDTLSRNDYILQWYRKPTPTILPPVRSTFKNAYGVWDMYGLIWEWVYDFNTPFSSVDTHTGDTTELNFSCAAGSYAVINKKDYASYMRYAFRHNLKANYTMTSLGFRCAEDSKSVKYTKHENE